MKRAQVNPNTMCVMSVEAKCLSTLKLGKVRLSILEDRLTITVLLLLPVHTINACIYINSL